MGDPFASERPFAQIMCPRCGECVCLRDERTTVMPASELRERLRAIKCYQNSEYREGDKHWSRAERMSKDNE